MKNNIMKWPHECITYWYLISKKYNFVWYWNYIIWLHFCPWYYLETGTAGWLRILFLGNYWKRIRNYVREQLACLNSNWFLLILYNCRHGVNTHFRMISSEEIVFLCNRLYWFLFCASISQIWQWVKILSFEFIIHRSTILMMAQK